jgi:hypothetical protein
MPIASGVRVTVRAAAAGMIKNAVIKIAPTTCNANPTNNAKASAKKKLLSLRVYTFRGG